MLRLPIPSLEGLATDRLLFRRPTMDDREWWMEYINNEEAIRFMPFTVGSEADCTFFIQRSLDRIARDGSCLNVISERATGEPVGQVGLLVQEVNGLAELEIGYHLLPSAWGHGYATEAAAACKEFAREHQLAPSVISLIDPENMSSQAVAKRNGMTFEKRGMHRGEEVLVFRVRFDVAQ
ncbi:MAG: GNAT family N-acetyltransferase [Flavobacteriales bacterium]|nr:GNAT family N-acetyltransferase [Flavobacteriales bacterium]